MRLFKPGTYRAPTCSAFFALMDGEGDVTQTAASTWILDLAGAKASLDLRFDFIGNLGTAQLFDVAPNVGTTVLGTVAKRNGILDFLDSDPHFQLGL